MNFDFIDSAHIIYYIDYLSSYALEVRCCDQISGQPDMDVTLSMSTTCIKVHWLRGAMITFNNVKSHLTTSPEAQIRT